MGTARTRSIGLDLGSTSIKAARLDERGKLQGLRSVPAPPLSGRDGIREGDASAYADAARELLEAVAHGLAPGTPMGIATQRSSFTLWDRRDGRPRIPLISWQDRRAADWCDGHRHIEPEIARRTGLPLSAHYAGPKLARVLPDLPGGTDSDELAFGTLETFAIWRWSGRKRHETDVTVAARTLMLDLGDEDWSTELLDRFGVPRALLPDVVRSTGRAVDLESGLRVTASLSDQAAAALAVLDDGDDTALLNFGTGAFVLVPAGAGTLRKSGYLYAPILAARDTTRYALEGTVNGAGPAVDRFAAGPTELPTTDPAPDAFAIPDLAGLGSPYWRPEVGLQLSPAARRLDGAGRRRIVLEGLLFRIREILEELCETGLPRRIILAGGLIREPALGRGLAALLGVPLELLLEPESGLIGVSRLAAGLAPCADPLTRGIDSDGRGDYLRKKYDDWRGWFESVRDR